ncbi:UDP-N-acetylmuramoyl-L-alanine--D-glutamate ligase [Hydrogenophaga sp.]|uniref:UDP-N-acetylmuramoyl-L-alanine--D-glutamate ligase n=1 Tax=Hydrogenophaga sp. TaxID=1904254 RepID=UPI00199B4B35|nr:UDP-N-acetylmuramoyl-L-alanine--D-glutamate ligase [Hydrogenophaga sp.]MBD3892651.1 UDP-N-acetylmuramoyl-L-alanine--D-glutamate ligase [Hydrogenophaga sp.]
MKDLQAQQVLVLGLGQSGLAMARWCLRHGARVTVADTRESAPQRAALQADCPQADFVAGPFDDSLLARARWTLIARSPGLAPAQLQTVFDWARAHSVSVVTELDLFAQALVELAQQPAQPYRPQVLAITGTNGKTTVTSLTGLLLRCAGLRVALAGNIGPNLLDVLSAAQAAQPAALPEVWVLELSSFQLDGTANGAWGQIPTAAALLNLSEDHLDWHGSQAAYTQAKAAVFGQQALMVLNRDDARVMALQPAMQTVKVGARKQQQAARAFLTFGLDQPHRAGDWGIEAARGMDWLVRAQAQQQTRPNGRLQEGTAALELQRLMPVQALRIRGRHNAANALAALALASSTGAALGPMLHGLREYRGEPHRVEPVAIVNQVEYFDDSKGTNVGATLAAVRGLGAERRLVVILGGDGKGQNFQALADALAHHARAVLLIGRDAALIRSQLTQALEQAQIPLFDADSLPAAVRLAAQQAHAGDAVLLSPACASLDMFDNYVHRARVFVQAVTELAAAQGQALEGAP